MGQLLRGTAQDYYDILIPHEDYYKKCSECKEFFQSLPLEVQIGVQRDELNNLYFYVSHSAWFEELFEKKTDGIAIDIVKKERYNCDKERINKKKVIKGSLQKPIYLKELREKIIPNQSGAVVVEIGKVPSRFINDEVEFNLVILKNRYLCHYQNFYDLETYKWDLLDMGMYLDTLTYHEGNDKSLTKQEKYILSHKTLRFEIPFAKGKHTYSSEDIQPLYDSLSLTNYTIQKISIRAYSSVEGDVKSNLELQNRRANSIVSALQKFQTPQINNKIIVAENWVEFLNDIAVTNYASLSDLSKDEIKEKLKEKKIASQLEPYLQNHRKAIVVLELQRKSKYSEMKAGYLIELFNKSIAENNLDEAIEIQNALFDRIRNEEAPASFINQLEVPKQKEFGGLLNKNTVFKYIMDETEVYQTYLDLKTLEDLLPEDPHIKYNIIATKFKVWILGKQAVEPDNFKKEIVALRKYGIHETLVKRMLVNYNIILSEYYMLLGDFPKKDKALRDVHSNYKYLNLRNQDYLSLAQYFSSYAKYDWSVKLLEDKVKQIDVSEDMLFYYLNLTLIKEYITRRASYRTTMLNAININSYRFCKLFDPFGQGGITFQLLEYDYLRKTYCENCNK